MCHELALVRVLRELTAAASYCVICYTPWAPPFFTVHALTAFILIAGPALAYTLICVGELSGLGDIRALRSPPLLAHGYSELALSLPRPRGSTGSASSVGRALPLSVS